MSVSVCPLSDILAIAQLSSTRILRKYDVSVKITSNSKWPGGGGAFFGFLGLVFLIQDLGADS
jgi:hypothetical protein